MQPSWRLVWCNERCHKADCLQARESLTTAVARAGGRIVCLKKAKQVADWATRAQRGFYVVVTEWREAKPFLRALGRAAGHCSAPQLVVVTCEDVKTAHRAVRAMDEICAIVGPRAPRVVVRQDLGDPTEFALEMKEVALLAYKERPITFSDDDSTSQGEESEEQSVCTSPSSRCTTPEQEEFTPPLYHGWTPVGVPPTFGVVAACPPPMPLRPFAQSWGLLSTEPEGLAITHLLSNQPAHAFLFTQYLNKCGLEQVLREAAPDHYED